MTADIAGITTRDTWTLVVLRRHFLSRFFNGLIHTEPVYTYKSPESTVTEVEQEQWKTRTFINH
jgi:hypothetical protein